MTGPRIVNNSFCFNPRLSICAPQGQRIARSTLPPPTPSKTFRHPFELLTEPHKPLVFGDIALCLFQFGHGPQPLTDRLFPFSPRQNIIGPLKNNSLSPFKGSFEMLSIDGPTPNRPNGTHFLENRIALSLQFLDRIHRDLLNVDLYLQYNGPESMSILIPHFYVAGPCAFIWFE